MEKSVSNEMNAESVTHPDTAMIDSHIKEFMMLNESVEKTNNRVEYLKDQVSKLLVSNSNIQEILDNMTQKVSDIDGQISVDMKTYLAKKQELKDFQSTRENMSRRQWHECLTEIGNYADNFVQWHKEYSREVLMTQIEDHQIECRKINEDLAAQKLEIDAIIQKYDLDYIDANVDVDDLPSLNTVMSDVRSSNGNIMYAVRLTENTLSNIQNKIKQNKIAVNEYKKKEKTNTF